MSSAVDEAATRRRAREEKRDQDLRFADHPDWHRLTLAIRRQIDACVELDAPADLVARLADQAEALARSLEHSATGKRVKLVESGWDGSTLMNYLGFSPIMGRLNPASYGVEVRQEGERAIGEVTLSESSEGALGLSHGGVVSAIWDEVLACAAAIRKVGGPTGRLTIHYRKPTPLYTPLRFEAWVDRVEERKVIVHGECRVGETVVTEAEGLFVRMRQPGIDWNKQTKDD